MPYVLRRSLVVLLLAAFVSGCGAANMVSVLRSPYTKRPATDMPPLPTVDADELRAGHPRVPLYYLTHERTIEHQFYLEQEIWYYVTDVRYQYVVLDPDEERATTFRLTTEPREVVEELHLRAVSPAGEETVYRIADLVREPGNEGRVTYKAVYPRVEAGTLIEESYRLRRSADPSFEPPLYHDVRLQFDMPVRDMTFRYIYPSLWEIGIKQSAPRVSERFDIDRNSHAGHTIITATRQNMPAFVREPYSPYFKEVGPYLEFQVKKIYMAGRGAEVIYERPDSWNVLAERFAEYVFRRRGGNTGPVAEQARSIVDAAAPDSVKLAAIVAWVQDNIEETDEGGAEDLRGALTSRKANAMLITGLTQAMLEESGLDATFAVLHPVSDGYFDASFVSFGQFTAPAVLVQIDGRGRAVFPYIPNLPVSYTPEIYQGARAMKINEEGFDGFTEVEINTGAQAFVEAEIDVRIDEEGVVHVEEVATLRGAAAFATRFELKDTDAEEREETLLDYVAYDGEIRDFTFEVSGEDAREEPVRITLRYQIDDLVALTPEEVIFQTGGLLAPNALRSFETTATDRRAPIRIHSPSLTTKTIRIRYPEGWTLSTPLADVQDETRFGRISGTFAAAPGLLTATQRIELKASRAPATASPNLDRLVGVESRLYVPTLVFSATR
jgi:hypothetical protein